MLGEPVPLALVVALSPVSIIPAVLLVLDTDHPKPTGLVSPQREHAAVTAVISMVVGVALAYIGIRAL